MESASGIAFDFGAKYHLPEYNLITSFVIRNLGTMNEMRNKKVSLPVTYRAGVMYDISGFFNKSDFIFLSSDYEAAPDYNNHIMFGTEVKIRNDLALRFGYQNGYSERNFCGGIGISLSFLRVDYGFTPFSSEFGNTHRFSLKFNW